jgi:hypothetical protein
MNDTKKVSERVKRERIFKCMRRCVVVVVVVFVGCVRLMVMLCECACVLFVWLFVACCLLLLLLLLLVSCVVCHACTAAVPPEYGIRWCVSVRRIDVVMLVLVVNSVCTCYCTPGRSSRAGARQ